MSQEKVDAYKKEKANRKKAIQSAKKKNLIYKITGGIITVLVAAWLVCSIGWRYFDWYNPFAPKATERVYSAEELESIRAALGLDKDGNPITTTAGENTTSSGDTTTSGNDSTTAANDDSTTSPEDTTADEK